MIMESHTHARHAKEVRVLLEVDGVAVSDVSFDVREEDICAITRFKAEMSALDSHLKPVDKVKLDHTFEPAVVVQPILEEQPSRARKG